MHELSEQFQHILQDNKLLDSQKQVLLAVSGGVDSVVLLHLMHNLPTAKRPQISIAHVNHQLREVSALEEEFVCKLAQDYQLPIHIHQWHQPKHPETGIEVAARNERYCFFKQVMATEKINYLMTGHHQDDQVETILMRLTRGSALEQLAGIHEHQSLTHESGVAYLVRPLLSFSKSEIYAYAHKHNLEYMEDASNRSLEYTRNRFRNQIIPLLKEENPRFNQHVEQFAQDLADILEIAAKPIALAYEELVSYKNEQFILNMRAFATYSEAMQKAVLKQLLDNLYRTKAAVFKANYIDILYDWLQAGAVNSQLDLTDNFIAEKSYEKAYFYEKNTNLINSKNSEKSVKAKANTSVTIAKEDLNQWQAISKTEAMGLFAVDFTEKNGLEKIRRAREAPTQLLISEEQLELPLTIRHRKPGDRMSYKGLQGSKKIKDIFIDEKVPPSERDSAWLVEDENGTIIWLVLYRHSDLFTERETDKLIYILKYKKN